MCVFGCVLRLFLAIPRDCTCIMYLCACRRRSTSISHDLPMLGLPSPASPLLSPLPNSPSPLQLRHHEQTEHGEALSMGKFIHDTTCLAFSAARDELLRHDCPRIKPYINTKLNPRRSCPPPATRSWPASARRSAPPSPPRFSLPTTMPATPSTPLLSTTTPPRRPLRTFGITLTLSATTTRRATRAGAPATAKHMGVCV